MESSRDSSVWRNLAVTFGGGLALGAVGMKLTQTALRPVEVTPRPEPNVVTDRLNVMERRLERVEQTPAPSPPRPVAAPGPAPAPVAPIDQKVLEAVIGAVEARLHEQSGQLDRRFADLEARLAVMNQQDRQESEQIRQDATALRSGMEQELRQMREGVSRTLAGQAATRTELGTFRLQHDQQIAEMRREYRQEVANLRSEMEQSVETRIVTNAAAAAAAQLEEQLTPLRAEVQQKEQELAELRQRLADSERSVLDVVLSIAEVCRQAADRMGGSKPAAPSPAPVAPVVEIQSKAEEAAPAPAPPAVVEISPAPQPLPVPASSQDVPDFLREANRRTNWRVPLVSSVLVSTGYLVLMHYLSASLQ